jgi:hypothetical protein
MNKWLLTIGLVVGMYASHAQEMSIQASLDTNIIRIGEQFKLTLSTTYGVKQGSPTIEFPQFKDSIISKIDIVSKQGLDTFLVDPTNDPYTFTQRQSYLLTSYDSGVYVLPPFVFKVNGQEYESNPLAIQVATIQVDTTMGIVDIMDPIDLPITFGEYLKLYQSYIYWTIFILGLLILTWWLIKKYRARPEVIVEEVIPDIAPHLWAFQRLEELKSKPYFEQGNAKQHYIEITGIIRAYFEKRYQFLALELTSDEILREIRLYSWKTEQMDGLRKLLTLSDLVKFAKEKPTKSDIDWSFVYVEKLIDDIKIDEPEQETNHEDNA